MLGLNFSLNEVFMITGFLLSLYACVSNDVIQTLGTFLSSNKDKPVWMIWLYASAILVITITLGWIVNGGDMSFGRLDRIPYPEQILWWQILPPILLIIMTRKGIPVGTAFLILSIFSSNHVIGLMVTKSIIGYVAAMIAALVIYTITARPLERYFFYHPTTHYSKWWIVAKWLSTGFLWSQWIMQDAACLFVYLPRQASILQLVLALAAFCALLGLLMSKRGGKIQNIIKLKTNTADLRSATIIDLIYAFVLLFFIHLNNIPMSTTWVFVGLLAGREIALYHRLRFESPKKMYKHIFKDLTKVTIGLVVSIAAVQILTNFNVIKQFFVSHFA